MPLCLPPLRTPHTQVRAKYTTKSPTDCEPPVPPAPPGCEVQGVLELGVNPFTLVQTGVTLLTDEATCDGTTGIVVRLMGKEGGRRNVRLRRPCKGYF